ncbi:hypothetical protein Apa02nite_087510 [Actinoplanes palleronii]|uniref:Uncharacterized protein n=1 Tax=Actinoplanes palleronii TaxID=113570 RepID=A0ABQ4BPP6_9ACTN|nr:hypothetical protein Apa02nite_087510 [Actinoplanes palleronii]
MDARRRPVAADRHRPAEHRRQDLYAHPGRPGGRVAGTPHRATFLRTTDGYAVYQVPSGTYTFSIT